jgi:hypothetical protein
MTDLEKAARMALKALGYYEVAGLATTRVAKSITALRQALSDSVEQPAQQCDDCNGMGIQDGKGNKCLLCDGHGEQPVKQEPVAYLVYDFGAESQYLAFDEELGDMDGCKVTPLYEHPPTSKPWVGLTNGEIARVVSLAGFAPDWAEANIATQIVRVCQDMLKEKNA